MINDEKRDFRAQESAGFSPDGSEENVAESLCSAITSFVMENEYPSSTPEFHSFLAQSCGVCQHVHADDAIAALIAFSSGRV